VSEWTDGWPLVAHLWNILWALSTAAQNQRTRAEGDEGAAVGDDFDYDAYAAARWAEYLRQKSQQQLRAQVPARP
jgi:hypothetical protein